MWKVSGTAVQGRNHESYGIPCQDKIFWLQDNGVTSAALADGAGSARLSHYGAEAVCREVCAKLCRDFRSLISLSDAGTAKREILGALVSRLEHLASEMGCYTDDLLSTLIAAAADDEYVMLLHIGDGVGACFKNGKMSVVSFPDNGEFKNETVFVSSHDALPRMRLMKGRAEGISGFVLMSDGTSESFYDSREKRLIPLADEIRHRCAANSDDTNKSELTALFTEVVRNTRTKDDCSIIVMYRPDESPAADSALPAARTRRGMDNRRKFLGIFSGRECLSRAGILEEAEKLGLDHRQISGLIRDMQRKGVIEQVGRRVYRLKPKH
ncbi:MAG: protein phosphatase 2C domain-containing protein [Synergistaceae bacterium]|nr:protein phosphatase 2C domain-containing protein [Synergistaceae bacterium]